MKNNNGKSDYGLVAFISCIVLMLSILIGGKTNNVIKSNKLLTPSITIECMEVNGAKKCDTTYTYIINK